MRTPPFPTGSKSSLEPNKTCPTFLAFLWITRFTHQSFNELDRWGGGGGIRDEELGRGAGSWGAETSLMGHSVLGISTASPHPSLQCSVASRSVRAPSMQDPSPRDSCPSVPRSPFGSNHRRPKRPIPLVRGSLWREREGGSEGWQCGRGLGKL